MKDLMLRSMARKSFSDCVVVLTESTEEKYSSRKKHPLFDELQGCPLGVLEKADLEGVYPVGTPIVYCVQEADNYHPQIAIAYNHEHLQSIILDAKKNGARRAFFIKGGTYDAYNQETNYTEE